MSFLKKLFGMKDSGGAGSKNPPDQAVLVYMDGQNLPDEVYEEYDLSTIEDQLIEVIEKGGLGEFDGNEIGQGEAILYMYGPDAERLFSGIESVLRAYPLCKGARVVVRSGGLGAPEREVRL